MRRRALASRSMTEFKIFYGEAKASDAAAISAYLFSSPLALLRIYVRPKSDID